MKKKDMLVLKDLPVLNGDDLKKYFMYHVKRLRVRKTGYTYKKGKTVRVQEEVYGFYTVTKPLHVYKCLRRGKIANLIIPIGATVYVNDDSFDYWVGVDQWSLRKMRASEAYVHSIYDTRSKQYVAEGISDWRASFKYVVGTTVRPTDEVFDKSPSTCAAGIHFFINVKDALSFGHFFL